MKKDEVDSQVRLEIAFYNFCESIRENADKRKIKK